MTNESAPASRCWLCGQQHAGARCDRVWRRRVLDELRHVRRRRVELAAELDAAEAAAVTLARAELGLAWETIGAALGVPKQTAHRRHARHVTAA